MARYRDYIITEKAGPHVAGMRNTGVGTKLFLTEKQAEAGLRDGHLVDDEAEKKAAEGAAAAEKEAAEKAAAEQAAADAKAKKAAEKKAAEEAAKTAKANS